MGDLDEEQRLVLQRPTGSPDLANPLTMTFEEWRALSDGPLQLEAQVEQYVIEPLLRLCLSGEQQTSWQKRLKIPGAGVADYGVFSGGKPSGVIEVKIGVRLPRDGDWRSSPDFQQIFRYAAASNLPAALIDSSRIFLFAKGERAPSMWIDRHTATDRDLETIRSYLA